MRERGDHQAQGRTVGNLGNTYYLLGNYKKAIKYHEEVSLREVVATGLFFTPIQGGGEKWLLRGKRNVSELGNLGSIFHVTACNGLSFDGCQCVGWMLMFCAFC